MKKEKNYFSSLNYSMANEDASFEWHICQQLKPKKILSICGSGARFLPLASCGPEKITAVDLATQQLALAELRHVLMRDLGLDDYVRFFGYPPFDVDLGKEERAQIFKRLPLTASTRDYFQKVFTALNWKGLLYQGKWENTFVTVTRTVRRLVGSSYDKVFDCVDQKSQNEFFAKKMRDPLWKLVPGAVLFFIGNATFFNAVLYRGNFVRKNIPETHFRHYVGSYSRLFANGLARENFFLQLCFFGKLRFPEGNPLEVHPPVYSASQKALREGTAIELVASDVLGFASKTKETYDFVSMSNVPSYFSGPTEQNYLQSLARCLNRNALVVVRCHLRIPEQTDLKGFVDVSHEYEALAAKEKMQVYRIFVYKYLG